MVILDSLVHEEFLDRTADGAFVHRHYQDHRRRLL
jgi:hypothetical protein